MILLLSTSFGFAKAAPFCQPFLVYLNAQIPKPSAKDFALVNNLSDEQLKIEISKYEHMTKRPDLWNQLDSQMLRCILTYVKQDQDQDGIQDWSSIVDQKFSRILFPRDDDWDNDGILNPADPDPVHFSVVQKKFPVHLLAENKQTQYWQKIIWLKYKILAINHTARHSPVLLKEFYYLLKKTNGLKNLKFLYAFNKHDADHDMAAYHKSISAISVAGDEIYTKPLSPAKKIKLLSTLSHELGHAFLMENVTVSEFVKLSSEFGWKGIYQNKKITDFYDPLFFKSHPEPEIFASDYAAQNAHEWFAESFADSVLFRLGHLRFDAQPNYSKWLNKKLKSF